MMLVMKLETVIVKEMSTNIGIKLVLLVAEVTIKVPNASKVKLM